MLCDLGIDLIRKGTQKLDFSEINVQKHQLCNSKILTGTTLLHNKDFFSYFVSIL